MRGPGDELPRRSELPWFWGAVLLLGQERQNELPKEGTTGWETQCQPDVWQAGDRLPEKERVIQLHSLY